MAIFSGSDFGCGPEWSENMYESNRPRRYLWRKKFGVDLYRSHFEESGFWIRLKLGVLMLSFHCGYANIYGEREWGFGAAWIPIHVDEYGVCPIFLPLIVRRRIPQKEMPNG